MDTSPVTVGLAALAAIIAVVALLTILFRRQSPDYRALFTAQHEHSPSLCLLADPSGRVLCLNRHARELLPGEGTDIRSLFPAKTLDEFPQIADSKQLRGQPLTDIDTQLTDLQDQWIAVRFSASVADDQNRILIVAEDRRRESKMARRLQYLKTHDKLTGLHSRRSLEAYLDRIFENQSLFSKPAAMIYINIDQLKVVNDTCGHVAGDELVKQVVHTLREAVSDYDFFARVGGDEFAMVLEDTSEQKAEEVAEILRSTAEDITFTWDTNVFRQSISIGVALTSPRLCTITDIFGAADAACEQAKASGKNRVVVHRESRSTNEDSRHQMRWVSLIQQAFIEDRFELFFQPIVDIVDPDSQHVHYELLIRYRNDQGRYIPPGAFLPAAERYGLSSQIDLWVVTTTLDFLSSNPVHTRNLNCCSVNLSAHSLASHQTRSALTQLIMGCDFPPDKICFEVTETSAIQNLEEAREFIADMRTLGCRFALDDFGTGFSSLSYLKGLKVDYLKIDGSFIRQIVDDRVDRAMVTAVASLGREMGIKTIAEYVENDSIRTVLKDINVDYAQGYGIARPMPLTQAVEFYQH